MPVPESDISVLIPTYRYRDKVARALESALASGAGEIIVVDDRSCDGTLELLAGYKDARLQVYENSQNLGLWENHLRALSYAKKPWIKFIQADDYLCDGGLARYAAAVMPGVTVVWSCASVVDDGNGAVSHYNTISKPTLVDGDTILRACVFSGWILGSPSHMMVRSDVISRDPAAWKTELSADIVLGSIAAAQGSVVLLPSGALIQGAHERQDAKVQGYYRGLRRMVGTSEYLSSCPEAALRSFAGLWAMLNMPLVLRLVAIGVLWGKVPPLEAFRLMLRNIMLARATKIDRIFLKAAKANRRRASIPCDIDEVLRRLEAN